jgi:hypothetical protein
MLVLMPRNDADFTGPTLLCCRRTSLPIVGSLGTLGRPAASTRVSFLERPTWGTFRRVLAGLRKHCPAAKSVVVRTSWLPEDILGQCSRRPHRFVIRLNNSMPQEQAVETLLHEWAHALAWNYSLDKLARDPGVSPEILDAASHDEAWGCAYSRVWRAYTGVLACGGAR